MPKIGVIGTSLLTSFLISRLAPQAEVVVFEDGPYGGAWGDRELAGKSLPKHNNIIVARSNSAEKAMPLISEELDKCGVDHRLQKQALRIADLDYVPEQFISGSFGRLIGAILSKPGVMLRKETASQIAFSESSASINGESFDFVFLTPHSELQALTINGTPVDTNYDKFKSLHLRVAFDRKLQEVPLEENPDEVFDRVSVLDYEGVTAFSGRVRRERKRASLISLLQESTFLRPRLQYANGTDLVAFPTPEWGWK